MNAANERINIINVIILEYRVRIDPTFVTLLYRRERLLIRDTSDRGMRSRRS